MSSCTKKPCGASAIRSAVYKEYSHYAQTSKEMPARQNELSSWGYSDEFLAKCGFTFEGAETMEDLKNMLSTACGGGCPLRLPGSPQKGETVVDIGCGDGHDVVIVSRMVGPRGKVLGIDLTGEMVALAKRNVSRFQDKHSSQVEFHVCSIDVRDEASQNLPHTFADVAISNGVINLCPDKAAAMSTIFHLLKPKGRFLFNDLCSVEACEDVQVFQAIGCGQWSN